jgi:hypothetical protein
LKPNDGNWQKKLWKLLTNPAIELVATIAVVMFATWYLIQTEAVAPNLGSAVLFGRH